MALGSRSSGIDTVQMILEAISFVKFPSLYGLHAISSE